MPKKRLALIITVGVLVFAGMAVMLARQNNNAPAPAQTDTETDCSSSEDPTGACEKQKMLVDKACQKAKDLYAEKNPGADMDAFGCHVKTGDGNIHVELYK